MSAELEDRVAELEQQVEDLRIELAAARTPELHAAEAALELVVEALAEALVDELLDRAGR